MTFKSGAMIAATVATMLTGIRWLRRREDDDHDAGNQVRGRQRLRRHERVQGSRQERVPGHERVRRHGVHHHRDAGRVRRGARGGRHRHRGRTRRKYAQTRHVSGADARPRLRPSRAPLSVVPGEWRARSRFRRGRHRELPWPGRAAARRSRARAPRRSGRTARRVAFDRRRFATQPRLPSHPARALRRDRARGRLGPPLLRHLGTTLRPRSLAAALHRRGARACRRSRRHGSGRLGSPARARKRLQLRDVRGQSAFGVGVPERGWRPGGLRRPARHQQRLRERPQPRLRPRSGTSTPSRSIASRSFTWPAIATRERTCSTTTARRSRHPSGRCTGAPFRDSGRSPTIIEWDENVPSLDVLAAEVEKARKSEAIALAEAGLVVGGRHDAGITPALVLAGDAAALLARGIASTRVFAATRDCSARDRMLDLPRAPIGRGNSKRYATSSGGWPAARRTSTSPLDAGVPGRSPVAGSAYRDGLAARCRGFCARTNRTSDDALADLAAFEWAEVEALLAADPPERHDRVRRAEPPCSRPARSRWCRRCGSSRSRPIRSPIWTARRARPLSPSGGAASRSKTAGSNPTSISAATAALAGEPVAEVCESFSHAARRRGARVEVLRSWLVSGWVSRIVPAGGIDLR